MRLHLPAFAVIAMLAASADAATRTFTVRGFDRIRVDGPDRVKLKTNVAPFANASGSTAALDALSVEVEGRTLVVRRKVTKGKPSPSGLVEVWVGTHELATAWLNGSGGLAIDGVRGQKFELGVTGSGAAEVGKLKVDKLQVSVSGSAQLGLSGVAEAASFDVSGPSSVDAANLSTKAATISAEGPTRMRLTATDTAKVLAKGLATVELSGEPACTVRPTSTAEVSGCR